MKKCSEYCGAACIDGHSCPNILLDENPDLYYDIYGTYKKLKCCDCIHNNGCDNCCIPYYSFIYSIEECQKQHKKKGRKKHE